MTHDMREVIKPKVDQLTADDLLGGPMTIRVTGVKINPGAEQPISVFFEGDGGKPWRPCKTTARLMVAAWGPDAKEYTGRSLTLYRDETVKWGGLAVGGLRISHMSHIDSDLVLALTMTKGKKAPARVKPLKADVAPLKVVEKQPERTQFSWDTFEPGVKNYLSTACDPDETQAWWDEKKPERMLAGADDKQRAIALATMVKDKIAALRGADGEV
mgnify:CR=1 FL=1